MPPLSVPLALELSTIWDLPPLATKDKYLDRDRFAYWYVPGTQNDVCPREEGVSGTSTSGIGSLSKLDQLSC